ncbi:MAG: SRPBCC domain-containing protein [Bacteroidota bacterium]
MSSYDWSRFIVGINVNAPVNKLYDAWATRAGMERWFLRLSEYQSKNGIIRKDDEQVEAGDSYKWLWHGWPDETVEYGTIKSANGKDSMSFSFGKAGDCIVKIFSDLGETIVELVQENIPTDEQGMHYWHVGCKTGWTFYFANLKSMYEGGIDLRNKNEKLQGVINA